MAKYPEEKNYNSDIQIGAMKSQYPQFKTRKRKNYDIDFIGDLVVKPEFPIYKVLINYRGDKRPIVKILSPELVEEPPHFYFKSKSLCLYHPYNFRWSKDKLISNTIVPWTSAWIYFYEVWKEKGEWLGPEASHEISKETTDE